MNRVIIICEGPTEKEFCNDVLQPYFSKKEIFIHNPVIKQSNGGIVAWNALKNEIIRYLKHEKKAFVTTFIDYYGLESNYPKWHEAKKESNKFKSMDLMEHAMLEFIDESFRARFIPYIQLHEFEGLLFSDKDAILNNFDKEEINDIKYLNETIENFKSPELINDSYETAPSRRLSRIIKGYGAEKSVYGSIIAKEIGLEKIRNKCKRFNSWIEKIENIKKWN